MMKKWKSLTSNINLYNRSIIIYKIRRFFFKNNILEVDTPSLTKNTVTDIHLFPFKVFSEQQFYNNTKDCMWLITSPEYHMKRLLASGVDFPIYQICHAFRSGEIGQHHNPEFSILEWYEPYYDMFRMINSIDFFLQKIINTEKSDKISYRNIFIKYFNIDPLNTNVSKLNVILNNLQQKHLIKSYNDVNDLLDLIFILGIQPNIGKKRPIFIYHYPANQALLAKINSQDNRLSDRFEFFFQGLELGNGFFELIDAHEQRLRFIKDNYLRFKRGFIKRNLDIYFLDALLSNNMPKCSGVAIGLDRLIMIALGVKNISDVLTFSHANC